MKIDSEKNLLEPDEKNSFVIDDEIIHIMDNDEGQNIKADIELLKSMGFDKKMINKVYILLRPENIERAIDYMTEIDGIYQHDFIESTNPKEKNLCFICKKPKKNHLDYIPDDLLNEGNNNLINNEEALINNEDNIIQENENINVDECEVCYDEINNEDKEFNSLPCRHLFCTHCWQNYLKTLILEAKVENIKCMNHECNEYISDEFILKHISKDENLIEKYKKFKKRAEIIKDNNKKICPNPDCDSYLQKSKLTNYVQCENGHKYCFECLKPPHGKKSCDFNLEKDFMKWKEGKRVKRCPRCKMYTEKNEGCNHMTCVNCKYQWCWLCEGKYVYGHYDSGKCRGHQFTKADNIRDLPKRDKYQPLLNEDPPLNYFGLHNIIPCVFRPIHRKLDFDECWKKFLLMLAFWFFGVWMMFIYTVFGYYEIYIGSSEDCKGILFVCFLFFDAIFLNAVFLIQFFSMITPFIFVSFIYPKFFDRLLLFFEVGND